MQEQETIRTERLAGLASKAIPLSLALISLSSLGCTSAPSGGTGPASGRATTSAGSGSAASGEASGSAASGASGNAGGSQTGGVSSTGAASSGGASDAG